MSTKNPNALALSYYRRLGYMCATVETFVAHPAPGRKHDLFGIFDILAFGDLNGRGNAPEPPIGVQATTLSNVASRINKIRRSPYYADWLLRGNQIVVIGFRPDGIGSPRVEWMTLASHAPITEQQKECEEAGL